MRKGTRREKTRKRRHPSPPPLHKDKASVDNSILSLSLAVTDQEAELLVPGVSESAFLLEFSRSLTDDERHLMHVEIQDANPGASARELLSATSAAMLKAGLAAQKKKSRDERDLSRSLSLASGNTGGTVSSANTKNKDAFRNG